MLRKILNNSANNHLKTLTQLLRLPRRQSAHFVPIRNQHTIPTVFFLYPPQQHLHRHHYRPLPLRLQQYRLFSTIDPNLPNHASPLYQPSITSTAPLTPSRRPKNKFNITPGRLLKAFALASLTTIATTIVACIYIYKHNSFGYSILYKITDYMAERSYAQDGDRSIYRYALPSDESSLDEDLQLNLTGDPSNDTIVLQQLLLRENLILRITLEKIAELIAYRQDLAQQGLKRCALYRSAVYNSQNPELYADVDDIVKKLEFFHQFGSNSDYMKQLHEVHHQLAFSYLVGGRKYDLKQNNKDVIYHEIDKVYNAIVNIRYLYEDLLHKQHNMAEKLEEFLDQVFFIYTQGSVPLDELNSPDFKLPDDLIHLQDEYNANDEELLEVWNNKYPKELDKAFSRGKKVFNPSIYRNQDNNTSPTSLFTSIPQPLSEKTQQSQSSSGAIFSNNEKWYNPDQQIEEIVNFIRKLFE